VFAFGIVVEGVYDEQVISALVEKIFSKECRCLCRLTGGKSNLMKKFPGFLEEFRFNAVDKALVVRDADRKLVDQLRDRMEEKVLGRNYPFALKFCVIKEEMETWLLADEKAISRVAGKDIPRVSEDLENIEKPKEKLMQILSRAKVNYTPEVARKIAEAVKPHTIEYRCPGFKAFRMSVLDC